MSETKNEKFEQKPKESGPFRQPRLHRRVESAKLNTHITRACVCAYAGSANEKKHRNARKQEDIGSMTHIF